jgi:hypothetical protein
MAALLVRDLMTIGVAVCREGERCGVVAARLAALPEAAAAVVGLDDDGLACGWATRARVAAAPPERFMAEILDEVIPTVAPDIPAETAAQLMRDQGVDYLFLMHAWPGEPRPAAIVSRQAVEQRLAGMN